jgi:gamma-glutamylputrescine oxidase
MGLLLQNWWTTTLLDASYPKVVPLEADITCDVLIVGGGMAGISAAMAAARAGHAVALVERNILGGSTTGRSAGFLTPDSELELSQLIRRFGVAGARELWEVPCRGIDLIIANVRDHQLECDLLTQDSLYVGIGGDGKDAIAEECAARAACAFPTTPYDAAQVAAVLGGTGYTAGVRYGSTYGINAMRYCQAMKQVLRDAGVQLFEASPVTRLDDHVAHCHGGTVTAERIVMCIDKPTAQLSPLAPEIFHAQTFLSISEPLSDADVERLFPSGEHFQCWDSTLVYSYYRLTGDQRLLLGGGNTITTYWPTAFNDSAVIESVIQRFKARFPFLSDLSFLQYWPGLIDTTRDLLPVIIKDEARPYIHYVGGSVGLPWAAFAGDFAARCAIGTARDDEARYYEYFSDRRAYAFPAWSGKIITKPAEFALNNWWAKYRQVDTARKPIAKPEEF